jgi:Domain of unknown function (DUF4349)
MNTASLSRSGRLLLAVTFLAVGCSTNPSPSPVRPAPQDRKTVRSSELVVTVDTAPKAAIAVEHLVAEAGGFVERSNETGDGDASLECRIPAPQLEPTMSRVAALGHEERRSLATADVTDEYTDLEARLHTSIALRERLEQLLARANSVSDLLTVERELTRVQADIETMQARLEQLTSQVRLADLSVTLQRKRPKHQLGPLSYVGYGLWWGISKLFVIH